MSKIGIVMLSYNGSNVVVQCIQSLIKAKTDIDFELYLLDNAPREDEYSIIKREFDICKKNYNLKGLLVRSDVNHGYPKGNNIGIQYFLNDPDVTHICLLNSDVIVSDHWIDNLIKHELDAVGPVTNACGNEQTIPVPFFLKKDEMDNFDVVNAFSKKRHNLYDTFVTKTNWLGFFCFMGTRKIFEKVGFLDERFGRGGFEDDDYCIRIQESGYSMNIIRDTFIYHWGTASFSQLPIVKLLNHIKINKKIFEKKYGLKWVDRKWLPFESFQLDLNFLLDKRSDAKTVEQFNIYFDNVKKLSKNIALTDRENALNNCTLISVFLKYINSFEFLRKISKASKLFLSSKNILFLVRYPGEQDLKDGYYQRVHAIDCFLADFNRFYIKFIFKGLSQNILPEFVKKKEGVYEVQFFVKNPIHILTIILLTVVTGRIYSHSVLRLGSIFNRFLFLISRKRILDIHGVVPEEFLLHGDVVGHRVHNRIERFAMRKSHVIIGVTKNMIDYVTRKHHISKKKNIIILPILQNIKEMGDVIDKQFNHAVVYCGGLQKWQQVDKMIEYAHKNEQVIQFTFLVPKPEELLKQFSDKYQNDFSGTVTSSPAEKVGEWYEKNAFGLVLREDIIVNNAACPTKLIEYFQNDIVPIVDSPNIGDFKAMGYKYVSYKDKLPSETEWKAMIFANRKILDKIYQQYYDGSKQLKRFL